MKELSELLREGSVALEISARRKKEAIAELVDLLRKDGKIENPEPILKGILERERVSTTGIGGGIAIPHRLSPDVSGTVLALGRSREGMPFDAVDRQPVYLVFLIIGPEGRQNDHLRLLSRVARLMHDETVVRRIREAGSEEEILEIVRDREAD